MNNGQKMLEALQNNQLDEANDFFKRALATDSDEQLYHLADDLYHLGFLEETQMIYKQLLALYPEDDELKIGLAEIAIEANEIDSAMDWLLDIPEESETFPQALLVLADLYQVQGLYEVSEQKLLKAKDILPDEPVIQFALAELHFSMGKYAQAIRAYEELMIQGYDEFTGVNLANRCGSAYSALGDLDQAVEYLEQSVEENETVNGLFELGITYMQQKEFKRANEVFFKLKDLDPSYTSVYPNLAQSLEEENQLEKAAEVIQEGLRMDQYNYELFAIGAEVALRLEQEETAEDYYLEAIALAPENESLQLAYSNLLLKQERIEETVNLIDQALQNGQSDPQFYWNLAVANEKLEEYDKAEQAFEQAYPAFRQNKDFLKSYIYFLREAGNRTTIKQAVTDYLLIEPSDEEILGILEEINTNY
ncbi:MULTISPECIES: tetratricopeptide repeat protein [Carnobacterium]|uniref:Tetratricopeptide repeat protein n=1 Tax=Carnobacterium antarcticum TaxID=2126436 RepID=A0ABW4NLZ1_9LACT|nr:MULTISPECIES: tetratricopeptide repeat protein [unclassified Carnobacterium]ALV21003.1 TPR-repeat-containing protein, component of Menaquinone-cytochrome C reductase [Carnobacterium sp. CP1]QQP71153.1 tetratricopeptide repeat protein [Carnobacterium sp. CS13]